MNDPALFCRQSLNRCIQARPVSRIVEIRRGEWIVDPGCRLDLRRQLTALLVIFEGLGTILVAPSLLLRIAPQARHRAIEAHLEIVDLVDIGGTIRREQLDEPAEHLVAHDTARQRFRLAVGAFRPGQTAQHPLDQDAVEALEPGFRIVAAARADEIDETLTGDIARIGALRDGSPGDQRVTRQDRQFGDERFYPRVALVEFAAGASFAERRDHRVVRTARAGLQFRASSLTQLLHRAAPLSPAPLWFRRVSSAPMLSSTASNIGGSPKIMPCMAL